MTKLSKEQQQLFDNLTGLQQDVAMGKLEGLSDIDAYRASPKGRSKRVETQQSSVSEILSRPNVKAFIESVQGESINKRIMTREKALERLTGIANAEVHDLGDITATDSRGAIKQLSEMEGWNAAQKIDVSGTVDIASRLQQAKARAKSSK